MPSDAVVLAVSAAIQALCQVVVEAMRGQTPEQRAQMWNWYVTDVGNWRKFWGIKDQ